MSISNQETNYHLVAEDKYDARCGEIFITLRRVLVFHCSFCDKKYRSADFFLEHLSTHTEIQDITETDENKTDHFNPEECQETGQNYEADIECETHSEMNNPTRATEEPIEEDCLGKLCEIKFEVAGALEEELHDYEELQAEEEEKPRNGQINVFTCNKCNKSFNTSSRLKRHLSIHSEERNHRCTICGFAFKEKPNLIAHIRRHRGEKDFVCDVCSKTFFTRTEIEKHMRSHTGEKPYICSHCGMSFSNLSGLNRHTKRHTQDYSFKCTYCEKGFWSKPDLSSHLIVHTKEKPFSCRVCLARFPRRKSWLRHEKLHEKS